MKNILFLMLLSSLAINCMKQPTPAPTSSITASTRRNEFTTTPPRQNQNPVCPGAPRKREKQNPIVTVGQNNPTKRRLLFYDN